jgi:hypothetical protein
MRSCGAGWTYDMGKGADMQAVQLDLFGYPLRTQVSGGGIQPANSLPYVHVSHDIPLQLPSGTHITVDRDSPLKVYSIGFQPAKTIPEIPRWFIRKYTSPGDTILEPFAGSGTSLIEALRLGRKILWLDYHPLSQLMCRVKTSRVSPAAILDEATAILRLATTQETAPSKVRFTNRDYWFQTHVQDGLEILRELIMASRPVCQPALWLALASTVRKCSDMNGAMLLAARRENVQEIPRRSRADVYRYFRYYVDKVVEALAQWHQAANWEPQQAQEIPSQDARDLKGDWVCDAVITSPPYINAIDYVWASKFELHWLDLVRSDRDRLDLYSREIGTERISGSVCGEPGQTGNASLDRMIKDIYVGREYKGSEGQNELRARVVYKYFEDMRQHFSACYPRLRAGGHYCFAVGDVSRICGVQIPVASLLAEFAADVGFVEVFRFHVLLKNRRLNIPRNVEWAGTIKHDTVVVMRRA